MEKPAAIHSSHAMASPDDTEADVVLAGSAYSYLFPQLADSPESTRYGDDDHKTHMALRGLSRVMAANVAPPKALPLASVYTYFGQFLSHDISAPVTSPTGDFRGFGSGIIASISDPTDLDKTVRLAKAADVLRTMRNQHSRPLTLYSLYGDGPFEASPTIRSFYGNGDGRFETRPCRLPPTDLHRFFTASEMPKKIDGKFDFPRKGGARHVALIVDRRNDDNLILGQLHLGMMMFHNKAMATLAALPENSSKTVRDIFNETRKQVTWHYQWIVLHDFLKTLLHRNSVTDALRSPNFVAGQYQVPLEFSTAALRFGHSMVSAEYDFNSNFGLGGRTKPHASLRDLFSFTSNGKMGDSDDAQLPSHWAADWTRLTKSSAGAEPVDSIIAEPMLTTLGGPHDEDRISIAYRNLLRGFHRRLPFGQEIAGKFGLKPLPEPAIAALIGQPVDDSFDPAEVARKTPPWFYFLCEATLENNGKCAGPVASRIIAETIVGLLANDQGSLLTEGKNWTPEVSRLRTADGKPVDSITRILDFAGLLD